MQIYWWCANTAHLPGSRRRVALDAAAGTVRSKRSRPGYRPTATACLAAIRTTPTGHGVGPARRQVTALEGCSPEVGRGSPPLHSRATCSRAMTQSSRAWSGPWCAQRNSWRGPVDCVANRLFLISSLSRPISGGLRQYGGGAGGHCATATWATRGGHTAGGRCNPSVWLKCIRRY